LSQALRDATRAGHAYLVIDGTLIPIDRVAADRPFYSGKHRKHGMNLQVIATPGGDIVWVSGPLPGAVHDLTAARIWGIIAALAASCLATLGDKGYLGEDDIRTPYWGRNKPASQKDANRAHARLRAPRRTRQRTRSSLLSLPGHGCAHWLIRLLITDYLASSMRPRTTGRSLPLARATRIVAAIGTYLPTYPQLKPVEIPSEKPT
jgi:hypothetical protein